MEVLKKKAELIESSAYSDLKNFEMETILALANSDIEPLELKGMLKLIRKRDLWVTDYKRALENKK